MKIKKALISAAGFGSRFLPISKSVQKEMLPLINRPVIDYIVDDCIKAGIEEIVIVVSPDDQQIQSYYSENPKIYQYLQRFNKTVRYESVKDLHTKAKFTFLTQDTINGDYGTAVPVRLAEEVMQDEDAFLVFNSDDPMYHADGSSEAAMMIDYFLASGAQGLATHQETPMEIINKYGVADVYEDNGFKYLNYMVEKPAKGQEPSNLANIGKYIFTPQIFEEIRRQEANPELKEYLLTDSLNLLAENHKVVVYPTTGEFLDLGYPLGWLKANVRVAMDDEEMRDELQAFIKSLL